MTLTKETTLKMQDLNSFIWEEMEDRGFQIDEMALALMTITTSFMASACDKAKHRQIVATFDRTLAAAFAVDEATR
jgi:hypothetical protein